MRLTSALLLAALAAAAGCGREDAPMRAPDRVRPARAALTAGTAIVSVTDPELDLHGLVLAAAAEAGAAPVSLGPRLVVGEGADPANHTVVRVLDDHGVTELQFLAYPTTVRGGIDVHAGALFPGETSIVAAPLADPTTTDVRIFDEHGVLRTSWVPPAPIVPTHALAVGNFLASHPGDEIAIASRAATGVPAALVVDGEGGLLATLTLTSPGALCELTTIRSEPNDLLLAHFCAMRHAVLLDPPTGRTVGYDLSALPEAVTLSESAFASRLFVAGGPEADRSTLHAVRPDGTIGDVDAGARENAFWVAWYASDGDDWTDSAFVRNARYRHIRTDQSSPAYSVPDFARSDFGYWAGGAFDDVVAMQLADYDTALPSLWEPTFTHRHHDFASRAWRDGVDPATGWPFTMLSRAGTPCTYVEGSTTFNSLTYAPGLAPLDHLYVWPLRAFLRGLAPRFRGSPEHFVGLEPNHEHEIYVPQDGSIGDYNPAMIAGFRAWLLARYGGTIAGVNGHFGTAFADAASLDAPRGMGRGAWDAYVPANRMLAAWIEHGRRVVRVRLAQTMREALLAGFPPEAIKTHQIPPEAVGDPVTSHRITPMDWALAAGTGFGGTRYGVWYASPSNWLLSASSSGQALASIGEYHPLTTDAAQASAQARYVFEHGVTFIHHMPSADRATADASRAAVVSLMDGRRRPGAARGVQAVRAVTQDGAAYDIASLGGLLKSLREDGSWEGTVYVQPFHAHVEPRALVEDLTMTLAATQYDTGPIGSLGSGDEIEVRFRARSADTDARFTLVVLNAGRELGAQRRVVAVGPDWGFYRWTLRVQSPMDAIDVLIGSGERDTPSGFAQTIQLESFSVVVHDEQIAEPELGVASGVPHAGGVTFDVLSRDRVPASTIASPFAPVASDGGFVADGAAPFDGGAARDGGGARSDGAPEPALATGGCACGVVRQREPVGLPLAAIALAVVLVAACQRRQRRRTAGVTAAARTFGCGSSRRRRVSRAR